MMVSTSQRKINLRESDGVNLRERDPDANSRRRHGRVTAKSNTRKRIPGTKCTEIVFLSFDFAV
eukprot:2002588-Rhodomonas_salina.1